ncbi:MAG: hypothetical protein U0169_04540 [Polyangiaceae bacterium]
MPSRTSSPSLPNRPLRPWDLSFAVLLAFAGLTQGCATAVWHPRVQSVAGEYKNTEAMSEKADATPEGRADAVKAIVSELPPGITLKDDLLEVDASRYEVLGKVSAKPAGEFFYPYRESWRKPACYPQRVLVVATLYLWMASPTSWPCFISEGSVDDRRDRIVEAMKRATHTLGGNMVLVGGFGGTFSVSATSKTTAVVHETEATEGVGWAIRVKTPGATPAPAPTVGLSL